MGNSKAQKVAARRKADAAITNNFFQQPVAVPTTAVAPPVAQTSASILPDSSPTTGSLQQSHRGQLATTAKGVVEKYPSIADDSDDSDLDSHSELEYPLLPFMTPEVVEILEKIRKLKAEHKEDVVMTGYAERDAVEENVRDMNDGKGKKTAVAVAGKEKKNDTVSAVASDSEPGENPHKGKFGIGLDPGWLGELERMMAMGMKK